MAEAYIMRELCMQTLSIHVGMKLQIDRVDNSLYCTCLLVSLVSARSR